jgi:hypothetical protein
MWESIIGFLGGPVVKGLIEAYKAKLAAGTTDNKIASDLAANEISAQTAETNAQTQYRIAEFGHPWEPDKIMGYTVAVYFAKLLIWDKVLGLGSTDPLTGFAATTATSIVFYYFAKRGAENIAQIFKSIFRR